MAAEAALSPAESKREQPRAERLGLWNHVAFTLAHTAVAVLWRLLSLRGLYQFGRFFGTLEWIINYKRRRRFTRALAGVLGPAALMSDGAREGTLAQAKKVVVEPLAPAERRRATREHFMRTRCDKLFYLVFDCLPRKRAARLITITNKHLLDEAVARGRGVFLAYSHHGPHHICGLLVPLLGYKTAAVRDRQEGGIRRYVQDRLDRRATDYQRTRFLFDNTYPREIYRCYDENCLVGAALDVARVRRENQRAEVVELFGQQRPILTGPIHIALKCGAPVIQAFILAERGFRYRLDLVEVLLDPQDLRNESAAIRAAVQRYAANVERYLRRWPSLITKL